MEIELDPKKTAAQNAADYFEKAKKLRRKAEGAKEAIARFAGQLEQAEKKAAQKQKKKEQQEEAEEKRKERKAKQKWYEKFRWFISSTGFLCIGGRDATTNEIIIKKHMDNTDYVLHTEAPGSPFFVVKSDGKNIDEQTKHEAASATVIFSKAWKLGITTTEVYGIEPEQVSKKSEAGEYLVKGAFMIRGKRTYYKVDPTLAVGRYEDAVMAGPLMAVKKHCEKYVVIQQDKMKPAECAKRAAKYLETDVDDVLRALPAGGGKPKLPNGKDL